MESVAVGILLVTVGGLLNGTWNIPTKKNSPSALVAVSEGWTWDHVWVVFQVFQALLNTVVILAVVTPAVLHQVYATASLSTIILVCTFCLIWGLGSLGFGMAIKMLGMAVGTSSTMGVIQVVGTCLPIFMEVQSITLKAGLLTLFSVLTGLLGFAMSVLAANRKARDLNVDTELSPTESQCAVLSERTGMEQPKLSLAADGSTSMAESVGFADAANPLAVQTSMARSSTDVQLHPSAGGPLLTSTVTGGAEAKPQPWKGILVALGGGLASSMLQFAFVYGDELVTAAESRGVPIAAAPMVVWLLAFNLSMIPNLIVSSVRITRQGGWGGFVSVPLSTQAKSGTLCFLMACFFMGHIHLYGAGAAIIGDLGAAIGWPILMSVTVLTSQLWSVLLQEWKGARQVAQLLNIASMLSLMCSVSLAAFAAS